MEQKSKVPTGWSCKCINAWESTFVHPAKEGFSVNNFICCLRTPFFCFTNSAICLLSYVPSYLGTTMPMLSVYLICSVYCQLQKHIFAKASASWLPGGRGALRAGTWKTRSASGSYKRAQVSFHIPCPHKGLFIIIHPSLFIVQAITPISLKWFNCQHMRSADKVHI